MDGLGQLKKFIHLIGFLTRTFQLVTQWLNHYTTACPKTTTTTTTTNNNNNNNNNNSKDRMRYWMDWSGSGYRELESSCECGNEPLDSINAGKFFSGCTIGGLGVNINNNNNNMPLNWWRLL
jgi:hypothetical protein